MRKTRKILRQGVGTVWGTVNRAVVAGLASCAAVQATTQDLGTEPIHSILERLRKTGKLVLEGIDSKDQRSLFQ